MASRAFVTSQVVCALLLCGVLRSHLRSDGRAVPAVLSHVFAGERTVTPSEAALRRLNPLGGEDFTSEPINGGTYHARADVLGLGARYRF